MKDSTKVLLGFAAGVAAGVGLYALSQTDKGKEIMKDVGQKAVQLKKEMEDFVHRGKDLAGEMAKKFNGAEKETPLV